MNLEFAAAITDAGLDLRRGACLADRAGHILAGDAVVARWLSGKDSRGDSTLADLVEGPDVLATLELAFSGDGDRSCRGNLRVSSPGAAPVLITMRRMAGAIGPVVLVELHVQSFVKLQHDALTGLPDRRAIGQTIESWRNDSVGAQRPFAVLFLDLDHFKQINDRHGHVVGDRVLAELASRWLRCVREGDLVARYGGDEFVLLIRDVASPADVEPVIRRLKAATEEPINMGSDAGLRVSAAVGVAIAQSTAAPIEELIAAADRDMYARKRRLPR